jgi:hypothetical protein
MVFIHQLHKDYSDTLFKAASALSTMLDKFEDTFAPVPPAPDTMWIDFMIDLITLGTVSTWVPSSRGQSRTRSCLWGKHTIMSRRW